MILACLLCIMFRACRLCVSGYACLKASAVASSSVGAKPIVQGHFLEIE